MRPVSSDTGIGAKAIRCRGSLGVPGFPGARRPEIAGGRYPRTGFDFDGPRTGDLRAALPRAPQMPLTDQQRRLERRRALRRVRVDGLLNL